MSSFRPQIEELIVKAIAEDIGDGDITTLACIPAETTTSGKMVLKQSGVVAGLPFLEFLFQQIHPNVQVVIMVEEGSKQKAGTVIAKITGPACAIISGERVALNMLQHASGVATTTRAYKKRVAGSKCDILDTRKTLPGLRSLEKYAVEVGGGINHRCGLFDRFIIKNNHLAFLGGATRTPVLEAYKKVKAFRPDVTIEIEVTDFHQLEEALKTDAAAIMLDHMTPDVVYRCVKKVRNTNKKVYIESAGAITLETIHAYAETGVDGIAISALTHSVQALDIGMRLIY